MAFRKIVTWPSPALKKKSEIVTEFNDELTSLAHDLYDTLNVVTGVGLAAPQIGVHQQVVVINTDQCESENPSVTEGFPEDVLVLVNPKLELSGPKHKWLEACLSVPDSRGLVERSQYTKVTFNTLSGEEKEFNIDWPASGVFQHECDHLTGVDFTDKVSKMKLRMAQKKASKKLKHNG